MPYPFAHPAAVIPLCRPMGRFAVPSALAIGSIAPDLWYFLPGLHREDTHSAAALLWFCLPAGLVAYFAFHLLLKHPLLALLPEPAGARLRGWAAASLPDVSWVAVLASLLAGALTHLAWDALTHPADAVMQRLPWLGAQIFSTGRYPFEIHQLLQHGSTALGVALLTAWSWRKRRRRAGKRAVLQSRRRCARASWLRFSPSQRPQRGAPASSRCHFLLSSFLYAMSPEPPG